MSNNISGLIATLLFISLTFLFCYGHYIGGGLLTGFLIGHILTCLYYKEIK